MHRPSIHTALCPARLSNLLAATARQDETAFAELYDATRRKLFGIALMVLRRRDLAEDVIQEAFLRVWRHAGSFDPARSSPLCTSSSMASAIALYTGPFRDSSFGSHIVIAAIYVLRR